MTFKLPPIHDAPSVNGVPIFGPSIESLPREFSEIPYESFAKSDRVGACPRPADWFVNEYTPATGTSGTSGRSRRTVEPRLLGDEHEEGSFSLVDSAGKSSAYAQKGRTATLGGPSRTAGNYAQRGGANLRGTARGGAQAGRGRDAQSGRLGGYSSRGGRLGGQRGQFRNGRWVDSNQRARDPTVQVRSDWQILEEIEFSRLAKLRLDVDTLEPEDISSHGFVCEYDKAFDKVSTKSSQPLQGIERVHYNPTTSDDPIIQDIASKTSTQVFATDNILSLLMCTTRSVYPWDMIIVREGDKLYFDKRDIEDGPFDSVSVNENAAEPPVETKELEDRDINSPSALSLEATYVNNTFAWQVVKEDAESRIDMEHPNPFYSSEETQQPASCGYRYRKFDMSITEEEPLDIIVRTEVDAFVRGAATAALGSGAQVEAGVNASNDMHSYITVKTLFEFDHRATGAGGAPNWRTKLDSQRGAVVATEMKNNSCKLARFAVQSILAGAEQMKMGFVSRAAPKDDQRHVIVGTQWYKPRDFAGQMNMNLANGWGIVRTIVDLCLKQPDGKYVLMKDPNKPVIRLYRVPYDTFENMEEEIEEPADAGSQASDTGF